MLFQVIVDLMCHCRTQRQVVSNKTTYRDYLKYQIGATVTNCPFMLSL